MAQQSNTEFSSKYEKYFNKPTETEYREHYDVFSILVDKPIFKRSEKLKNSLTDDEYCNVVKGCFLTNVKIHPEEYKMIYQSENFSKFMNFFYAKHHHIITAIYKVMQLKAKTLHFSFNFGIFKFAGFLQIYLFMKHNIKIYDLEKYQFCQQMDLVMFPVCVYHVSSNLYEYVFYDITTKKFMITKTDTPNNFNEAFKYISDAITCDAGYLFLKMQQINNNILNVNSLEA